jgi:hypothetical protein
MQAQRGNVLGFSGNDLKGEDILGEIYEKELQKTSF